MPSCASCDRYLSPATVRPDGTCPQCGRAVQVADRQVRAEPDEPVPFPWHFKLAALALVVYLVWRFYEGIAWLFGRIVS